MPALIHQRCFNHGEREAVARCPECHRFFCRECVAEHDDRVVCAACLKKLARVPLLQRRGFVRARRFAACAFGLFAGWFFFYLIAQTLASLPHDFHEGTLWQVEWIDQE
ncbi:MAG TPA: rhomboid family protein [Verrucomicrobiota bacterium]|nr:rhomboid family protein [Verrucomicrobiota bacterium]